MTNRKAAGVAASVLLVAALVTVVAKLALAPLYQRYDTRQCRQAYAEARTYTETTVVDQHPYGARHESRNLRCGQVRGVPVDSLVLLTR